MRIGIVRMEGDGVDAFSQYTREVLVPMVRARGHVAVSWPADRCDFVLAYQETWWGSDEWASFGKPWAPIAMPDHAPISPRMVEACRNASVVVAASRFAESSLKVALPGKSIVYVPHAYDSNVFNVAEPKVRFAEDAEFVVGCVKANYGFRANFSALMGAYRRLVDRYGWDRRQSALLLRTNPRARDGLDLVAMARRFGISDYVTFLPVMPRGQLADLYRCLDVHVNSCMGDGVGLPSVEAQACGTPALSTDWAGGAEQVPQNARLKPSAWVTATHMGDLAVVTADEVYDHLVRLADDEGVRLTASAEAFRHVAQYNLPNVAPRWSDFFDRVEEVVKHG